MNVGSYQDILVVKCFEYVVCVISHKIDIYVSYMLIEFINVSMNGFTIMDHSISDEIDSFTIPFFSTFSIVHF